eukprot:IDg20481t1
MIVSLSSASHECQSRAEMGCNALVIPSLHSRELHKQTRLIPLLFAAASAQSSRSIEGNSNEGICMFDCGLRRFESAAFARRIDAALSNRARGECFEMLNKPLQGYFIKNATADVQRVRRNDGILNMRRETASRRCRRTQGITNRRVEMRAYTGQQGRTKEQTGASGRYDRRAGERYGGRAGRAGRMYRGGGNHAQQSHAMRSRYGNNNFVTFKR